ncbi:hypothetical protein [Neofamilia massiliensis]|uniref:hypothetical protein n=1 Tax=Neofamilia massiliensis TaxID=1673724 RepID=UPI0006BB568C|nr:hypothetical protein [Neofamilia massiliensis]
MNKKRILFIVCVFILCLLVTDNVLAFSKINYQNELKWDNSNTISLDLDSRGSKLFVDLSINSNHTIYGNLYLEKYTDYGWENVNIWPISGNRFISLSKIYSGQAGSTYRARVTVNIGGENFTTISNYVSL